LVNIKDRCKNTFEVINRLRINSANSHHRYNVIILINGVPAAQIELKTPGINPAGPWSRSSITRTTPATATPRPCYASSSSFRQQPGQHLKRLEVCYGGTA
jgi:hypothetical protein